MVVFHSYVSLPEGKYCIQNPLLLGGWSHWHGQRTQVWSLLRLLQPRSSKFALTAIYCGGFLNRGTSRFLDHPLQIGFPWISMINQPFGGTMESMVVLAPGRKVSHWCPDATLSKPGGMDTRWGGCFLGTLLEDIFGGMKPIVMVNSG